MISRSRKFRFFLGIGGLVLGLSLSPNTALASNGTIEVVPPDSVEFGNTYGEWSARWWQWLVSIPAANNPNFDTTGAHCAEGQTGPVWFLAGTFGDQKYIRSCTIPGGKDLLVTPLATLFGEFGKTPESDCPNGPDQCDPTHLRSLAAEGQDDPKLLEVRVGNAQVENVEQYRVTSPVFNAFFPKKAIFPDTFLKHGTVPSGSHGPFVSDGYFVLLKPLPSGMPTIHLKGISNGGFMVEVTYRLTVTN